jgi:hypothetical protein
MSYYHFRCVTMLISLVIQRLQDSLWEQAAEELGKEDKETLKLMRLDKVIKPNELLKTVEEKKQVCKAKQWKYKKRNGDVIIFHDIFDKIATWVEKFKQVGDIAVSYDVSGHAALPWAGVKLLIGVSGAVSI